MTAEYNHIKTAGGARELIQAVYQLCVSPDNAFLDILELIFGHYEKLINDQWRGGGTLYIFSSVHMVPNSPVHSQSDTRDQARAE